MKFRILTTGALLGAIMIIPAQSTASAMADDFDSAVKQAEAAIDNAKSVGFEWRDSRKILKQAVEAEKAGDHDKALKLAEKARMQGVAAVAQADSQRNAGPPR